MMRWVVLSAFVVVAAAGACRGERDRSNLPSIAQPTEHSRDTGKAGVGLPGGDAPIAIKTGESGAADDQYQRGRKPMEKFQTIADRVEIEALRGEFTDALMMHDYDRFASLFTRDGVWRIPYIHVELVGRERIRAGIERMQGLWDYFVQTSHPGWIQLDGDSAVGRAYILELGRQRNGRSELNYSVYHDRYHRTADGWKFMERVYEVNYVDTTPLAGSAPHQPR
jgi:ketosteroid isomerase-like protein